MQLSGQSKSILLFCARNFRRVLEYFDDRGLADACESADGPDVEQGSLPLGIVGGTISQDVD